MNNLELNPVQSLDPATEQLIHRLVQALLKPTEKGECRCHWIDPTKTPILAWKSTKDPDTLVLKIAQQKFIGLTRSDKNNEMYWKFKEFYEQSPDSFTKGLEGEVGGSTPPPPTPKKIVENPPLKPETDSEAVNFPSPSTANAVEESEVVKKFREKYGTPSNPKEPVQ